jgi:putative hydrolase of the HAD superfamily
MTSNGQAAPAFDWADVKLVVFDVDGTLYSQNWLRMRMVVEMAFAALVSRDVAFAKVVKFYRTRREELADHIDADFESLLVHDTSVHVGCSEDFVRGVISDWMGTRPLRHLRTARYPFVSELFHALRICDKKIGIFSDYPAQLKLEALGLQADFIVSAGDRNVGYLKPNPRGLELIMSIADVCPDETVLIGDRVDKDGMAAKRAGAHALIRANRSIDGWRTFPSYRSSLFLPIFAAGA